jgi:hypothetical protein
MMMNDHSVGSVKFEFLANNEFKLSNRIRDNMVRVFSFWSYNKVAQRFRSLSFSVQSRRSHLREAGRSAVERNVQC